MPGVRKGSSIQTRQVAHPRDSGHKKTAALPGQDNAAGKQIPGGARLTSCCFWGRPDRCREPEPPWPDASGFIIPPLVMP